MADLRQACDRCHSKKLRCTKIPGSIVCARCVKAGVTCLFSPPTRSLRHPDILNMDWGILGLDQPLVEPQSVDPDHLIATPPISDDINPTPSAQITVVSQLTDLMAAFDRMQNSSPASLTQHLTLRELNEFMKICDVNVGAFLEELLQCAQKLVHLYPQVLKQLEPRGITSCEAPDFAYSSCAGMPPPAARFGRQHRQSWTHVCSCRSDATPECEPRLDIPEIKIGSFVAPKISAASMVIALVIELQTSLNARAQNLHDVVSSNLGHDARSAKILGLQCESLKEHATQTDSDLHSLREHLQNLGVIG
ncbi:Transcription factor ACEII [Fusarium culmorum]|uniref:Transcription factor ACEII n=1 Tax=Fusarium culmorum TaxID=5516 RepID=A0A2T4H3Z0_FUSCU|nr:Transcription factor ACEII [Fusarium culmorum]